ncbi:MAG: signal peptide peptidase SppA [Tannerella sp.]|jgi:protease-4|nr:signal peptide peptidase SppA [Tannerella sp.]
MKQFIKIALASTLGVILAVTLLTIITIVFIIGTLVSANAVPNASYTPKSDESIFKISLAGTIDDSATESAFAFLLNEEEKLSLKNILTSIQNAKELDIIKGIYLDMGVLSTGTASIDAIRRALIDFKKSGKFIVAYADNYTQSGYYLVSVADEIYLNPQGLLGLTGFASQTLFYKGLLQKAGIEMMVFKVGTYKGAVEPFIADKLSDANREQITSYMNGIWDNIVNEIADSRKISTEEVNAFADKGLFFSDPANAVKCGLIDGLKYRSEVETLLMEQAGQTGLHIKTLNPAKMKKIKQSARKYRNKIALIYAEGEITQTAAAAYQRDNRITEKLADELRKLKDNENVKAIVIRVNSPGGSAYISEQIWKQVIELKKTKPVVVSMGNISASGGYYISCAASKIVAEANTLTGSIGVFGIFPNTTGLFEKLALTTDVVKTNKYADLGDISRPMTDEEKMLIQGYVEKCYDTFLTRCADGRNMSREDVDAIGQGRVWTGEQALEIGLVDDLGGIDRAVEIAAELADMYNYELINVSTPKDFLKDFLEKQLEETKVSMAKDVLGEDYEYFTTLQQIRTMYGIQARIPYDLKPL